MNEKKCIFTQLPPHNEEKTFVDSFWEFKNLSKTPTKVTILPDGLFKVMIQLVDNKVKQVFFTGIWTKDKEIIIPANATIYGVKFKILAPEYVFNMVFSPFLQSMKILELDFWGIDKFKFDNFQNVVSQFEHRIKENIRSNKTVPCYKLELSKLLYLTNGHISVSEVAEQLNVNERQISRYLNKYFGISLKVYLSILKCRKAYIQIREGKFFPEEGYYDQAHFIKEIKKHTGETPKKLYDNQNDRFIQLKHISKP